MSSLNYYQPREMKIQHITHDEARIRRSNMIRRASDVSMVLKSFVSSKISRHSSDPSSPRLFRVDRPVTVWPVVETNISAPLEPFATDKNASITRQPRKEKGRRKEERTQPSIPVHASFQTNLMAERQAETEVSQLRPHGRASNLVKERLEIKSFESPPQETNSDRTMEKLQKIKEQIKDGKMEQVIPPSRSSKSSNSEVRLAPPPRITLDYSPRTSNETSRSHSSSRKTSSECKRDSSRSRKTKSSSRKFADYIRTSAGILDEKRRDVQSKFHSPFTNIIHPSVLSRRTSNASSIKSFWCVGDPRTFEEKEKPKLSTQKITDELKPPKREKIFFATRKQEKENWQGGEAPWAGHPPEHCKICRKFTTLNIQELCQECAVSFNNNPKSSGSSKENSDSEWEDDMRLSDPEEEIKPTPPLKDRHTLSMRKSAPPSPPHYYQPVTEDQRKVVPLKDMGLRPIFNRIHEKLDRKRYEFEYEGQGGFLDWETAVKRDEEVSPIDENDTTPLIRRKRRGNANEPKRNTKFYRFYDDVLGTH